MPHVPHVTIYPSFFLPNDPFKYLVGRLGCCVQSSLDDDDTVKRPRTNPPRGLETQGERSNARTGQTLEMSVSKEKGRVNHDVLSFEYAAQKVT